MANRNLTAKQQLFLEALVSEEAMGDLRTAMTIAGYSTTTKVVDVARQLRKEIREASETLLALYAPKAVLSLVGVLDDPTPLGARNQIAAAKEVLDRVGISAKTSMDIAVDTPTPIFILPPKQSD